MIRLAVCLALSSNILAVPVPGKWSLTDYNDYVRIQLGACDASGLPADVLDSIGLDPSGNYELNENFYHSMDVMVATSRKTAYFTGLLGTILCDATIRQIHLCNDGGYCSWSDPELEVLSRMSTDEREEVVDSLEKSRETFARLMKPTQDLFMGYLDSEETNPIQEAISTAANKPVQNWHGSCLRRIMGPMMIAMEQHCGDKIHKN